MPGRNWVRERTALGVAAVVALVGAAVAPSTVRAQEVPSPALLESEFLLSVGEIVDRSVWRDAEALLGTAGDAILVDESHTLSDRLYVPAVVEGRALVPGDRLQTFRLDRPIDDPATSERLGSLLLPTGVGEVETVEGETATVRVTRAFHPILVGDRVRLADGEPGAWPAPVSGVGTAAGWIVAFQEEKALHPTFDVLFLRSEVAGPLAPGHVVELYRPGGVRDGMRLPDRILGEAMVVRVDGELAAAVTFELKSAELQPGDPWRTVPWGATE